MRWIIAFAFGLLVACGDGSGLQGNKDLPEERPFGSVKGIAFDGLIVDGDVKIYSFASGLRGELLANGKSDFQGRYSIEIRASSQPILIEVTGGRYVEEASGRSVPLLEGQALYSVTNYISGQAVKVSATYYTTLATALAEYLVKSGVGVDEAVLTANKRIKNIIGIDLLDVTPVDITDVGNASAFLTASIEYGFYTAAVSAWTLTASDFNKTESHKIHSSIVFSQLAYDDLRADGILDGKGTSGLLSVGIIPLSADIYRHELAVHLLNMARDVRNKSGLSVAALVDSAERLNNSEEPIFGDAKLIPFGNGPVISGVQPTAGAILSGRFDINAIVTDATVVTSVEFRVDGLSVGLANDVDAPTFSLDSNLYPDGEHTVEIVATNFTGESSVLKQKVVIDNTAPIIRTTNPVAGAFVHKTVEFGSDIDEPNLKEIVYSIDEKRFVSGGVAPLISMLDTTQYADGLHKYRIDVEDLVGMRTTKTISVIVDNTAPTVESFSPLEGTRLRGDFNLSAMVYDAVGIKKIEYFIDGVYYTTADNTVPTETVSSTKFTDGAHTLTISVTDMIGHETRQTVNVVFDNTPPTLNYVAATIGGLYEDTAVRCVVNGSAWDATSGIKSVTVGSQAVTLSEGRWTYSFIGNTHKNPFQVVVLDSAANMSFVLVSFTISIVPGPYNQWAHTCKVT